MFPTLDLYACATTSWQTTPDMPLRVGIGFCLAAVAGWAAARKRFPGQPAFVCLALVMASWIGFSLAEHAAVDAGCKVSIALLSWSAIATQPPLYALFLYQYLRLPKPPGGQFWPYFLPSALMVLLSFTNAGHGLFYGAETRLGQPMAGLPRLLYDRGPAFYTTAALSYAWLMFATVLMFRSWRAARHRQQHQWGAFLLMMFVPLTANAAYLSVDLRLMGTDPTPSAFSVALMGFAWLIRRERMFAAAPMGRQMLFDELPDPVLVLDAEGRIVQANQAARRLHPAPTMGQLLQTWPRFGSGLAALQSGGSRLVEVSAPAAWYQAQQRSIGPPESPIGALLQLHDVSEHHQAHARTMRTLADRELALDKATSLQALLREQAMHDPLTGLLNRRALVERHGFETRSADAAPTLVLLDLDHFKRVNDSHGHLAGDAVLRDFGAALRSGLRAEDALFRIGGEEFVVLMSTATPEQAAARVQELREIISHWRLGQLAEALTFSAGVAAHGPNTPTLEALLAAADGALYQAKGSGRNRTVISVPALGRSVLTQAHTPAHTQALDS